MKFITPELIKNIKENIKNNPCLLTGESYELKKIIGEDEWKKFNNNERREFGKEFKFYINEMQLPLKLDESIDCRKTKKYTILK